LESTAEKILDRETLAKLDSMDEKSIKIAIIKAENKSVNLDGRSDTYIDAAYDFISSSIVEKRTDSKDMGREIINSRNDSSSDEYDSAAARKKSMERSLNAWKRPSQG
jgi:hypothetical protein